MEVLNLLEKAIESNLMSSTGAAPRGKTKERMRGEGTETMS